MKYLSLTLMGLMLVTQTVRAEAISATAAAASITFLSFNGVMTAAGCAQEKHPDLCGLGVLSAHLALSASTILLLKENVQEVEADSMDFIAGEPMSLSLEEMIQRIRQDNDKIRDVSDLELAAMILQSLGR